ncbi:MAG: recombination protein O N-terminal domain-containing protein [Candidatus Brennerbacteria bacterium]|nr:recombination protein O N-terminal domain-containing protein [Candidatus Brennerbacteria bacterium]
MREYLTDAIVLGHERSGDFDVRLDFYTRDFGRLKAKAKSLKKTTSKLAGHLEPLTLAKIRLIEKNGFLVADALTINRFEQLRAAPRLFAEGLRLVDFFKAVVLEGEPDFNLWRWLKNSLITGKISYDGLKKILGGEDFQTARQWV